MPRTRDVKMAIAPERSASHPVVCVAGSTANGVTVKVTWHAMLIDWHRQDSFESLLQALLASKQCSSA